MVCAELSRRDVHAAASGGDTRPHISAIGGIVQRLRELERRNDELESFIRALAHDSGSLTRGIGLRTQMLRDHMHSTDAQALQILDGIEDRAQRLGGLSESLLRLARIGSCDLECAHIDASAMVEAIAEELRRDDPARKVRVEIQGNLTVWGDPVLVRLALENLIGNAWKYTSRVDNARIEIGCRSLEQQPVFFIIDNGVGIPPENASALFSPFVRLATARPFAGTGLGLATVKRIVERHGGWIRVDGTTNRGAAFLFSLGPQPLSAQRNPDAA